MKILNIDNREVTSSFDVKTCSFVEKKRKPTFNLIVELTQEEYQLINFYLELDNRKCINAKIKMPTLKENKE